MFVTTLVVGAVITASGGSVKASGMFVRDIAFNLVGSTALFFMCLSERATLYEAAGFFTMYLVYVVAVTQGHRLPPLIRADRAAWYAIRENERAQVQVSENAPLLPGQNSSGIVDDADIEAPGTSTAASPLDERSLSLTNAMVAVRGGGASSGQQQPDTSYWRAMCRRMAVATDWPELSRWGRASFCFEAIVHLLRGLTIPVIPDDDALSGEKWNNAFQRVRAVCTMPGFITWMTLYVQRRMSDVEDSGPTFTYVYGLPLPLLVLVVSLPCGVVVYQLTRSGMPRWLRQAFVLPAFISSIAWFDVGADELVEVLRASGHILNIPIAVLGVSILAWGNSISDLLANRAIALQGHAKMAISGCYGEPNFNRFFGVGLAYALITAPVFPKPYTKGIFIDPALLVCFGFQTLALLVTLAAGMLDQFRIRSWLGRVLIGIYSVFMVVVVLTILYVPADWRL